MQVSLEEPFRYSPTSAVVGGGETESLERQTRHEISVLVAEMGALSRSNAPSAEFWTGFSSRLMRAMAADAIAVWCLNQPKAPEPLPPDLIYAAGEWDRRLETDGAHAHSLREVAHGNRPALVPPDAVSPMPLWMALVPLNADEEQSIVIECFLREVGGPASQIGYLRFVAQMADLANEYLRTSSLHRWRTTAQQWHRWEQATVELSRALTRSELQRLTVDLCSQLLGAERVSWMNRSALGWSLQATNGIDAPDPRGAAGKWLANQLHQDGSACRSLSTSKEEASTKETSSGAELDAPNPTHLNIVSVIPLFLPLPNVPRWKPIHETDSENSGVTQSTVQPAKPFAVLIIQDDQAWNDDRQKLADAMGRSVAGAYRAIALAESMPGIGHWLLKRGKLQSWRRPFLAGIVGVLLVAAILLIPFPLRVHAPATLEPVAVAQVQAPRDGIVKRLLVKHDQTVERGTPLAEIWDVELDRTEEQLLGQQSVLEKRSLELQRLLVRNNDPQRRTEWEAERGELDVQRKTITRELDWVNRQRESLLITSPIQGRIAAWGVQDQLIGKHVRRGDGLLQVIDSSGAWRVRSEFPQSRLDHLLTALHQQSALQANIVFRAFPNRPITGTLNQLGPTTATGSDGLPVGWSDIQVDGKMLPLKQPGAAASVSVDCGYKPLGYVLFQDLIRATTGWWRLWVS